jgi:hypothetical protein
MKTLSLQEQSFGIITKLMVLRAKKVEPRMLHAPFAIILSLDAVRLERSLIFLEELFSGRREQI